MHSEGGYSFSLLNGDETEANISVAKGVQIKCNLRNSVKLSNKKFQIELTEIGKVIWKAKELPEYHFAFGVE